MDSHIQDYLKNLSAAGGVINRNIVKATALGVLKHYMYRQFDELKNLITDSWARSLMQRMGLVKRKGIFTINYIINPLFINFTSVENEMNLSTCILHIKY